MLKIIGAKSLVKKSVFICENNIIYEIDGTSKIN